MIENNLLEQDNRRRLWLRPAAGVAAIIALSAATGWGVASLAAPAAAPDTAKVREALKLRLPKTPIDAINCKGLLALGQDASGCHPCSIGKDKSSANSTAPETRPDQAPCQRQAECPGKHR